MKEISYAEYQRGDQKLTQTASNNKLFYCKDSHGQVFSRKKSLYTSCGYMKEISYAEYQRGDQDTQSESKWVTKKTNSEEPVINKKDQQFIYCKDLSGKVEARKTSLYNSCGHWMKEISYAEYQRGDQDTEVIKSTSTSKQNTQTVIVKNDTTGPEIIVKKTFKANQELTAIIKGRVKDDSEIVELTIGGYPVSMQSGNFSKQFFC